MKADIVILGGGPAGMAAAISAYDNGVKDIVIIERENELGGILKQCIHNGFGLTRFKENLTGPEYAYKFVEEVQKRDIKVLLNTFALDITSDKVVTVMNSIDGVFQIEAKAVILAMGCRERSKGALNIPGFRPSGLYSAGTAQKYVNIKGYLPGERIVILGSGDIGLIMARRMTLEGAKVLCVSEIMPHSSGLKRNIAQCLNDFNIPLYLSHTIVNIEGKDRVSAVTIAQVDENKKPIKGTEKRFECDTVLFSVGLIPENELAKKANVSLSPRTKGAFVDQSRESLTRGIFECGNALHVHDLVDFVSEESEIAGKKASEYVLYVEKEKDYIDVIEGDNVAYILPQKVDRNQDGNFKLFFRVRTNVSNPIITLFDGDKVIKTTKKIACLPGEMETLLIKEDMYKNATNLRVSVKSND